MNNDPLAIEELINDLENELLRLQQLEQEMGQVQQQIRTFSDLAAPLYESVALKLHNFYTGCERIFQIIASELNGGTPSSYDWHRRLLERMTNPDKQRPAIIRPTTAKQLQQYLGFRHLVRNIYDFELDHHRLNTLLANYFPVSFAFQTDILNLLIG